MIKNQLGDRVGESLAEAHEAHARGLEDGEVLVDAARRVRLIAGLFAVPVVAWLPIVAAFGLILDGVSAMWERAGRNGNLTTHRQYRRRRGGD